MEADLWQQRSESVTEKEEIQIFEFNQSQELLAMPGLRHYDVVWMVAEGAKGMEEVRELKEKTGDAIYNKTTAIVNYTGGFIWGNCRGEGIPLDMPWSIKGSQTLPSHHTLPLHQTFTIHQNSTLTIPTDTTLTNEGILKLYGTVMGTGTLNGNGSFVTGFQPEEMSFSNQYYTGSTTPNIGD